MGLRADGDSRRTSGEDFDRALADAEQLLSKVDDARDRLRRNLLVECVAVAVILAAGLCVLIAVLPDYGRAAATAAAFVALPTVLVQVLRTRVRAPLLAEIYRDEKVMAGLVNILRELLPLLAKDERWTQLKITQTRMRLGRFPIEPRGRR